MTNEITNVNQNVEAQLVVRENDDFVVVKNAEGKFQRKAKFNEYSSFVAETREDKIWLLNLYEGGEGNDSLGSGLKEHVGQVFEVKDVITRRYDRINEETGELEYGILTYLITPDKDVFVTSSKTVYFSIMRAFEAFGFPHEEGWQPLKVKVGKQKGQNGDIITIKVIG